MPIALAGLLPAGAIGILTAGMFAAAMSTYNTYLHTWSAVLTQDVVAPWFPKGLSSRTRIILARCIMVAIAVFLLVWGLWYPLGQNLWSYMAVTGSVYFTGAFAVLLFGIYWRRASKAGAFAAFACGFLGIVALAPVQKWLGLSRLAATALHRLAEIPGLAGLAHGVDPATFKLSEGVVGLTTWGTALLAMVVFSLLKPDPPRQAAASAAGGARVEGVAD
jgi:Na+/proline symporter